MKFTSNKLIYIRRAVYTLLIVLTAAVQNTPKTALKIGPATALLPLALTVCIAVGERSVPALLFGALSGAFLDMFSSNTDGFFTFTLAVTGFVCSLLVTFQMQSNVRTTLLLAFASAVFVNTLYWLFFFVFKKYDMLLHVYIRYYLTSSILTTAVSALYFYIIKWIRAVTTPERKRVNY